MKDSLTIPRDVIQNAHDALEQIEDWHVAGSDTWILYHQLETFLYPDKGDIRRGSAKSKDNVAVLPVIRIERF